MSYKNIREEELKNTVAHDYFSAFDCKKIIGNIDFSVSLQTQNNNQLFETESLLWAEAKKGMSDTIKSIVQLILTIGKARTFDKQLPPAFLGAFDAEKIAFIPYNNIHEIFYQNDFNWNVAPSNHDTKEFKQVHKKAKTTIENNSLLFNFELDNKELHEFIRTNFVVGKSNFSKIKIDKNNFLSIYSKWLAAVKSTIRIDWIIAKKGGIIDADFFLADLLSSNNKTIKEKLYVLLNENYYELDRKFDEMGLFDPKTTSFNDNQKAHLQFWNKYERPPKKEYWDYIVERRDLLVPQDIRERKGSFFTPKIWVELSQKYIADVFGEDWQDEYYIWDCAAGTGNLLSGLTNKYNTWASTLDRQDVDIMKDRIKNGANILESHVFQFDFLNDNFNKLPKGLQEVINSPEKRKKLLIYINPPYAEHGNRTTIISRGKHKTNVAKTSKVYNDFNKIVGTATRELFAQFFLRIYKEIPDVKLASFSTLKFINSQNFFKFRKYFKAEYKKGFICRANTFDNVKGNFPIGFSVWDLANKMNIIKIKTNVYNFNNETSLKEGIKYFYSSDKKEFISSWLRGFYDKESDIIGYLILPGVDMQQQNGVYITSKPTSSDIKQHKTTNITKNNIIEMSIYLSVRQVIKLTWINNKDQFLSPKTKWEKDKEFQNNCLTYALFHGQNKISSNGETNHWIPFTEQEVNASDKFDNNFMTNFIAGKLEEDKDSKLFKNKKTTKTKLEFSLEAKEVFNSGKELWIYYHSQLGCNVNASLYDIKEYFQGRNKNGRMNSKSKDEKYTKLIIKLRDSLEKLSDKIEPKIYEYEFLKI